MNQPCPNLLGRRQGVTTPLNQRILCSCILPRCHFPSVFPIPLLPVHQHCSAGLQVAVPGEYRRSPNQGGARGSEQEQEQR